MLGRKIIEVYTDENSLDAEPTGGGKDTGLPVRRLRSAGLRIITENKTTDTSYLQVPTNRRRRDSANSGGTSILTPDTTHTFGLPNPTSKEEAPQEARPSSSSDVSSAPHDEKRHRRYSQQETALKSTFQHTTREPSHRDLQIRALERATAVLSMHAKEAQDRANKLRSALSEREVDPDTYRTLQRERWMEERRSNARMEESKALKQLMLKISGGGEYVPSTQRTQSLPGGSDQAKRQANLLSFSEKSPTKLVFTRRRGIPASKQHALLRSLTISETRPMRLRTSAPVSAFPKPVKSRSRTKSLQSDLFVNNSRPGNAPSGHGVIPTSTIPLATTPMTAVQSQAGPSSAALGVVVNDGGVATIYASQQPRTREQIDSDMNDIELPSYALDLFGEFDDIHGDITLSPATPPRATPPAALTLQNGHTHAGRLAAPEPTDGYGPHSQQSSSSSPPRASHLSAPHITTPTKSTFSAIRRPLSFMGHKTTDSVSSGGPGSSVRMSGDGVVLAERPSTPGSTHSADKPSRWAGPSSSPAKALSKMKTRFSMMSGRR